MGRPVDVPKLLQGFLKEGVRLTGNASAVSRAVGASSPGQLAAWIKGEYNPELARVGEIFEGLRTLGVQVPEIFVTPIAGDLIGHTRTRAFEADGGSTDDIASARVLQDYAARDRALAHDLQDAIGRLARIAAALDEETGGVTPRAPSSRKGRRKAG